MDLEKYLQLTNNTMDAEANRFIKLTFLRHNKQYITFVTQHTGAVVWCEYRLRTPEWSWTVSLTGDEKSIEESINKIIPYMNI